MRKTNRDIVSRVDLAIIVTVVFASLPLVNSPHDHAGVFLLGLGVGYLIKVYVMILQRPPLPEGLARRCAWCNEWRSVEHRDAAERGTPVSHTICRDCESDLLGEERQ